MNVPQVAQITKVAKDTYLIPGFEEFPIVMVKPSGNKARGTKTGWTATFNGNVIREGNLSEDCQQVLNVVAAKFAHVGYTKLREILCG